MTRALSQRIGILAGLVLAAACGGGGGDGGTGPPPGPPVPSRITLSQTGALALVSGNTTTVTATVFAANGQQLSVPVTWASSDANVARVQDGLITASRVGSATITASAGSVTSSGLTITVTPGPPAQLGIRTQPAGAAVAIPFATQPVVEIRDAAGNVVTTATPNVTALIASGGGALSGATTVTATAGVASFSNLALSGIVGNRTLSFATEGLTPVTSQTLALSPGNPAQARVTTQPVGGAVGTALLTQPVVELRDVSGNVATGSSAAVTAAISFGGGAVSGTTTVNASAGVATFNNLVVTGAVGDRELSFSALGVPPVSSTRFFVALVVYGSPAQKIQIIDVGAAVTPLTSAATPPAFSSRAPSRATVDNAGRITARADGQAWVVSSLPGGGDSVLTIVPRTASGPVLRTNLTSFSARSSDSTTVDLVLDPRTTPVGAANLFASIKSLDFAIGYRLVIVQPSGVQVAAHEPNAGVFRFSIASSGPISSPITFGRLVFAGGPPGTSLSINLIAIDAYAPNGADVYGVVTSTVYPVVFR
ncbi:MAG: Ig-like domain-containing protein [Gemmatimonadaceae bacterium]